MDAFGYIRSACTPDLQRAIDSKFTVSAWSNLSVSECIEEIKNIVVLPSNKAADKEVFYNIKQGQNESISTFFSRAHMVAANCEFMCPNCQYGLENYLLLSKIAVGLADATLKKEVYRSIDMFMDINHLRSFCVAFETAQNLWPAKVH